MIGLVMDYCVCKDMDHANGELLQNDNSVCIFFVTRVLSFKLRPSQTGVNMTGTRGLQPSTSTSKNNAFSATSNHLRSLLQFLRLNTEDNIQLAIEKSSDSGQVYPRKDLPAQLSRYTLISRSASRWCSLHLWTEHFSCHLPILPCEMKLNPSNVNDFPNWKRSKIFYAPMSDMASFSQKL